MGDIHPLPPNNLLSMEREKSSSEYMWELLSPSPSFNNCQIAFRDYWYGLSKPKQRQIFYTLREQKKRGEYIKENPLFAIQDCNPQPTDWNGKQGINDMMKTELMVIAKYGDRFGSYTLLEAWLFEMKEATAANFEPENLTGKEAERFNAIKKIIVR